MKIKRLLSSLLILALLCSGVLSLGAAAQALSGEATSQSSEANLISGAPSHTVQAKAAMLLELNSNQSLLEQNADTVIYPASLTKIMTCLLTLEHGTLTDEITVSETALQNLDAAGSTAGLQAGEKLTLEELLYCMMLSSANEACNVAAEYVAGSVDAFVEMMNEEAASLGCTNTHFANPHGLHDENHYTTARDLSLITKEALKSETFRTITSTVTHEVPATNLSEPRQLFTTNLLETPGTRYYYEYASGIKTGFTTPAGRCLISTAERPDSDLSLLSIVCGAADVTLEDGEIENQNFTETKALFEYGFDNFAFDVVLEATPVVEIPVFFSAGSDAAVLAADREISAVMPKDYDPALLEIEPHLTSPDGVEAPIAKGDILGTVTVSYQGTLLGEANLVAITDTARSELVAQAASTKSFLASYWWVLIVGVLVVLIILYVVAVSVNRSRRRKRMQQRRRCQNSSVIEFPGTHHRDSDED